jgi:uridine phosphorylase
MHIPSSELIINQNGSIYHLNLLPEDVSDTIITVGDQERVAKVSKYFDSIELKKSKREFTCHTGYLGKKRISVVSTGIGTDNIDIVFNELDALHNIDFETRMVKETITPLTFIRLGTSGCIQENIPIDSVLYSEVAIGIDNLNFFYPVSEFYRDQKMEEDFVVKFGSEINAYCLKADQSIINVFNGYDGFIPGVTFTAIGFYGPQGRRVRNKLANENFVDDLSSQEFGNRRITNIEMETAGMYLLATNHGHRAISINALIANRQKKIFSSDASGTVDKMIRLSLEAISEA